VDQNTQVISEANVDGQQANANQITQQSNEKTFTQDEVNAIVTKRLAQLEKKFSGVNLDEYNELRSMREAKEQEEALKRQEFDKVLGQVKSASEAKIGALQKELEAIKIDGALIAEASLRKAVAPDKVAALLRSQLKLANDGAVEVVDSQGKTRYNADKATPMSLSELVEEFLTQNTYFVQAGPSGTGSRNAGQESSIEKLDLNSLDMRKPEDRERYRKFKAAQAK